MFTLLTFIGVSVLVIAALGDWLGSTAALRWRAVGFGALGAASLVLGIGSGAMYCGDSVSQLSATRTAAAQQPADTASSPAEETVAAPPEQSDTEKSNTEKSDEEPSGVADGVAAPDVEKNNVEKGNVEKGNVEKEEPDAPPFHVEIDYAQRPGWVESEPVREGDVHTVALSAGPYYSKRECHRALNVEIKAATDQYINDYLDSDRATLLLNYDLDFIKSRFLKPENRYDEIVTVSFGPMHQSHALLEFDSAFREDLDERWRQVVATSHLLKTGLGAGGVLALLAMLLSYLKLDTATKGFYTGRLQFGTAMAILALIAAGVLLAEWIPWI